MLKDTTLIERKQNEETLDPVKTKSHSEHSVGYKGFCSRFYSMA